MRNIRKTSEPLKLIRYRASPDAEWDGIFTEVLESIREQLLGEQGRLCAYCMQRISPNTMKTEHWMCRARFPEESLNYHNMLGVCFGNEGQPRSQQTCDTRKADRDLRFNPANPDHDVEQHIRYSRNGEIFSDDEEFDDEINTVLNLNQHRLKTNREGVQNAVTSYFRKRGNAVTAGDIRRQIRAWSESDRTGKLREYCGVAVYRLNKELKRFTKRR